MAAELVLTGEATEKTVEVLVAARERRAIVALV